jgi:gluconate:H+ symporter, GntP family
MIPIALAPPEQPIAGGGQLIVAALAGITLIVALIT